MTTCSLSYVTQPHPAEAYASWLDRLCAGNAARPSELLAAAGVSERGTRPSYFGITLSDAALAALADYTDVPAETLASTLVSNVLPDLSKRTAPHPMQIWAYWQGCRYCPACHDELGYGWQLRRKFPWSFACTRHGVLLLDRCPDCGELSGPASDRIGPTNNWPYAHAVPVPELCGAPIFGAGTRPALLGFCESALTTWQADSILGFREILDAQAAIDQAVASFEKVPVAAYLRALRGVTTVVLHALVADVAPPLDVPPQVNGAVREHREDVLRKREIARSADPYRRHLRLQAAIHPPTSAALCAVAATIGLRLLDHECPKVFFDWAHDAIGQSSTATARDQLRQWQVPDHVIVRLRPRRAGRRAPAEPVPTPVHAGAVDVVPATESSLFDERHLPTLFWADEYDRFAAWVLGPGDPTLRHFCSAVVVAGIQGGDWRQAADVLGYRGAVAPAWALRSLVFNKRSMCQFQEDLVRVVERRAQAGLKLDYTALRAALATYGVPDDAWAELCAAQRWRLTADQRRRAVSAHIWSVAVESEPGSSPAYTTRSDAMKAAAGLERSVRDRVAFTQVVDMELTRLAGNR